MLDEQTLAGSADEVMAEAAIIDLLRRHEISPEKAASVLGMSGSELARVLEKHGIVPPDVEQPKSQRPIDEVLAELASEVPQEEWDNLPADLSDQLDHYIYGTPQR